MLGEQKFSIYVITDFNVSQKFRINLEKYMIKGHGRL